MCDVIFDLYKTNPNPNPNALNIVRDKNFLTSLVKVLNKVNDFFTSHYKQLVAQAPKNLNFITPSVVFLILDETQIIPEISFRISDSRDFNVSDFVCLQLDIDSEEQLKEVALKIALQFILNSTEGM